MLANATPPLLLMLLFVRKEIPRIGLPRVPRRLAPDAWQPPAPPQGPGAAD